MKLREKQLVAGSALMVALILVGTSLGMRALGATAQKLEKTLSQERGWREPGGFRSRSATVPQEQF